MTAEALDEPGWAPLVYFWDGGWVGVGRGRGVVPPHAHHAIQITLGLDGEIGLCAPGEPWSSGAVGVVQADVPHSLDPHGALTALLFVDPECREGHWLRDSLRTPILVREAGRLEAPMASLRRFREERPGADAAARVLTDVVHALAGGPRPLHRLDPRIVRALECIRASRDARLSLEQVAREVFLSPSRFAHLFSAEIGVPFRRYLLWRKLSTAMQQFGRGENLSAAAHSAGFADSAHLTRTWVRMFGMAPTLMVGQAEFYEIPAPFEFTTAASEVESG